MRDEKIELRNLHDSHTLHCTTKQTRNVVYYESRKRELKIRLMNAGRCDERLKGRVEESTCLTCTGLQKEMLTL